MSVTPRSRRAQYGHCAPPAARKSQPSSQARTTRSPADGDRRDRAPPAPPRSRPRTGRAASPAAETGTGSSVVSWLDSRTATDAFTGLEVQRSPACPSLNRCTALGSIGLWTWFAARWDGHRWTSELIPKPTRVTYVRMKGLSCVSANACTAVADDAGNGDVGGAVSAYRWNGRRWSVERLPLPIGARDASLFGVSCTSGSACVAVGGIHNARGYLRPFVLRSS